MKPRTIKRRRWLLLPRLRQLRKHRYNAAMTTTRRTVLQSLLALAGSLFFSKRTPATTTPDNRWRLTEKDFIAEQVLRMRTTTLHYVTHQPSVEYMFSSDRFFYGDSGERNGVCINEATNDGRHRIDFRLDIIGSRFDGWEWQIECAWNRMVECLRMSTDAECRRGFVVTDVVYHEHAEAFRLTLSVLPPDQFSRVGYAYRLKRARELGLPIVDGAIYGYHDLAR